MDRCRVCGNRRLEKVLDLGQQALTGRFPRPTDPDPLRGPLQLVLCYDADPARCCGLLQLAHSYPLDQMYGEDYGYRSANNQTMKEHLRQKVRRISRLSALAAGDHVLDIGSNDGTLLSYYEMIHVERTGVDPSAGKFAADYPKGSSLLVDFFTEAAARPYAGKHGFKVITSLAMFYDLESPLDFMRDIRSLLAPEGVWEFEQAYLPDILEKLAYDSVCHEHLSYYGLRQIQWMADRAGLKLLDVDRNNINGGSFSVTAARAESSYTPNQAKIDRLLSRESRWQLAALVPYAEFAGRVARHRDSLCEELAEARREGRPVLGYGASTKGNVILQYCGLTPTDLPAIAEKYPVKFGRVTPGTRIPIISETEAYRAKPSALLVLPWYFRDEIVRRESAFLDKGGELILSLPSLERIRSSTAPRREQEAFVNA